MPTMICRHWLGATLIAALSTAIAGAEEPTDASNADKIVVTGRKVAESSESLPISASTLPAQWLSDLGTRAFSDYAMLIPNLSYAYGNGESSSNFGSGISNARTVAIRGISGAGTTGFYLDDTPLPASIDPRIVDVHDIEVLRGPQGTLYGESSLGGNIQWIGNVPKLDQNSLRYSLHTGWTQHGDAPDAAATVTANSVLIPNTVALRTVIFADNNAGFLTRTYPSDPNNPNSALRAVNNQGAQRTEGASATLRAGANERTDIEFRLLAQHSFDNGFPATYAPLPAFNPINTLARSANIQPFAAESWVLPSLTLTYLGDGWRVHSSVSFFERHSHDQEDSTEGTAQAIIAQTGVTLAPQPYAWSAFHYNQQFTHETRFNFTPTNGLEATAGFFYSLGHSQWGIPPINGQGVADAGLWPTNLLWVQNDTGRQQDASLFGELNYPFLQRYRLTLGFRHYWLEQTDQMYYDGLLGGGVYQSNTGSREHGTSPKLALSYQVAPQTLVYASASQGFRAGGAQGPVTYPPCGPDLAAINQTSQSIAHIAPDWVWNYELGAKTAIADGLHLDVDAFHINWQHIQQSIFLPHCAFYVIGNAGAARVDGGEIELHGQLATHLAVRAGLGYENGRITEPGGTGQAVGSRIYQVPRLTASFALTYSHPIDADHTAFLSGDYAYTGDSVSANSGAGLNLVRPSYSLANLRSGIRWQNSEAALAIKNLTNAHPNLGDISYIGYERYMPGTSTPLPQVATLPPRTVMLEFAQGF